MPNEDSGVGTMRANDQALLRRLHDLQFGEDQPTLLFSQSPFGLGGQISRRLLGLRLALFTGRKVVFPHAGEPPYGVVFKPLHSACDYEALRRTAPPYRHGADNAMVAVLDYETMDADPVMHPGVFHYLPPYLADLPDAELYLDGLLLQACPLLDEHRLLVEAEASRLSIDRRTLGVHVRRGDKSVETPYVPLAAIESAIVDQVAEQGWRKVFVTSDDPDIASQIRLPHGVELIFDHTEKRYNNANHRLLAREPQLQAQETRTALKNIYLLASCGAVVGQDNAHFSTLAAAAIYSSKGINHSTLIQGDIARTNNVGINAIYFVKNKTRKTLKSLIPKEIKKLLMSFLA